MSARTPSSTRIDCITIGDRHRKDMGDLDSLADSIESIGLLQPIGITPTKQLVFGHRRLVAARMLGWETIPTVTVELDSIVAGEFAENEIRKSFTLSERHAICQAIEAEEQVAAKERQGERTDLDDIPQKSAECKSKSSNESRNVAARQAGLGSHDTASKVAKVVDHGSKDLVAAMDKGTVSINAAAKLAELPKREQTRVAKAALCGDKQAVKEAITPPKPAKPLPRYPLSDGFVKVLEDLVATLNGFRADYDGVLNLFEHKQWDDDKTSYAKQLIASFAKTFTDLNKEIKQDG